MEKKFSDFLHSLTNWGVGTVLSVVITLIFIIVSLPFTYIGYSIRNAIWLHMKKYEGYAVKKYTRHAIISAFILLAIEIILFFVLNISKFYSISFILACMVILGLMGVKFTFSLEKMIEDMIEGIFEKD